jgi:sulfatase maturation enzyme AslB (radical SAM superfamily)
LDCKYCVYLEKYVLYPQVSKWAMQVEVLDGYIRQHNEAHNIRGYYGGVNTLVRQRPWER